MRSAALLSIVAGATLALAPLAVGAQIYKCEGADGVVEYSNSPPAAKSGRTCRTIEVGPITVIPAPKPAPRAQPPAASATAARSPEGFPKVDPVTQRARDDDRRRILQDELTREEARLAELRKEYNNGEPERQGNERNYQKYLDRVQRLKDDIERSEANVATIRKELSALKP
jgi:hypothetical protein